MKFSHVVVIAAILFGMAWINQKVTGELWLVLMLFLLLGAVAPWLAVPLGVVAIIYQLFMQLGQGQGKLGQWLNSFGSKYQGGAFK